MARVSSLKGVLVAAGVAGVGAILSIATPVKANTVLFTTFDDWSGGSAPATTSYDSDGSTTDGIGNLSTPGAPGTGGAASFALPTGRGVALGYGEIDTLPSQGGNNAFLVFSWFVLWDVVQEHWSDGRPMLAMVCRANVGIDLQ